MPGFRQDFCFAVQEGDAETLALLNEGLAVVMADGTYSYLHHKWFAFMEIPSSRALVVAGDSNFPPFEYLDSLGNPAGLNVDLIRLTAAEVGLDVEVRLDHWSSVLAAFTAGEADILCGMFYSPARDLEFDFTQPHTIVHYVPVVASGTPPGSVAELSGMRVAVQERDIAHDFLAGSDLSGELLPCPSQEDALLAVLEGDADCAVVARLSAAFFMDLYGWELVPGKEPLISPGYCFAVASGNVALKSELSEGLRAVVATGGYRRAFERWMGSLVEDEPPSLARVLRSSLVFVLPLIGALLLVMVWVRTLRRQVRLKTADLRRNQALLNTAQEVAVMGGWEYDLKTRRIHWSDEVFAIHGMEAEENPRDPSAAIEESLQCYLEDCRERVRKAFEACVENGIPYRLECRFKSLDGREKWIRTAARAELEKGEIRRVVGYIQDITDFKTTERRIAHLNVVLRAIRDVNQLIIREEDPARLLEKAADLLVEHRSYSYALLILVSPTGEPFIWRHAGLEPDTAKKTDDYFSKGEMPPCYRSIEPGCNTIDRSLCRESTLFSGSSTITALCAPLIHGGVRYGYITVSLLPGQGDDEEERALLAEMADDLAYALAGIREKKARRKAEKAGEEIRKQLIQSQKIEAVGQLAGGIAHDFNNMLQVILGHAQMLKELDPCEDARSGIEGILDGAGRAADLTRQLLLFSRRQVMTTEVLDFNLLVEDLLRMVRRLIGEHIRLEWVPGSAVGAVKGDKGMLEQVIMNLCVNARDAMPEGGVLTIETIGVLIDSQYCRKHSWARPGRFILLSVTDTGTGMDPATMERIFEPFFTTKEPGKGTGIGLATAYGIVKQHDGMINAYSEPGKGSIFKVYLPLARMEAREVGADIQGPAVGGTETVLLAEDDPMVRSLAEEILRRAGYKVLTASDGHEAIEVYRSAGKVDLLLLDVIMPGMSGHEVMNRIRASQPDIPVLFTSGYSDNAIHTNFVLKEGLRLLQKPYSQEQLLRTLRGILDRS
jgi:PAS domain S-box-containing protein